MSQTVIKMGILGPGEFTIPCEFTCEMCKKASSFEGTLINELAAGDDTAFAIKSICLKCGHIFINPSLKE